MRVTVKEWAEWNGVTERAVRARLARGTLPGAKERDPSTGVEQWYVYVPDVDRTDDPDAIKIDNINLDAGGLDSLVALVRDQQQTIIELSGRCGWLQAQLHAAHERIALLEAPKEPAVDVGSRFTANSDPEVSEVYLANLEPEVTNKFVRNSSPDPASASTANRSDHLENGPRIEAQQPQRRPWWAFWHWIARSEG